MTDEMAMAAQEVVVENAQMRLAIGADGTVRSLVLKSTGEELLDAHEGLPFFSVTQDRPFNNEIKLTYPNCETTYRANRVRRDDDMLTVGFEHVSYAAKVRVAEREDYVLFELVDFDLGPKGSNGLNMTYPPVKSLRMLNLPVRNRKNFGNWLNVCWDDAAAIAVVAAEPYTWIDSRGRDGFRLLRAEARTGLRLRGAKAALVAAPTEAFLDAVDCFERDLGLPRGVESRRSPLMRQSIYWTADINPANADEHIAWAKKGGFRKMLIYHPSVCDHPGGYRNIADYRPGKDYPDGYASIREMLAKIKAAGITPGLHLLQTFIGLDSHYVTPVADPRLNLKRHFTLAKPLADEGGDLFVQEDPSDSPTNAESCVLAFGGELLHYDGFVAERPYRFTGVTRGYLKTNVVPHPRGQIGGVLDVCEFGAQSCYIDQQSDLQDEIAGKIAKIYDCGFEFLYCDGSEGVNVPQGIHVANAQYRVWRKLGKKPLFMEGAAKTHFGWHHLAAANAFDIFPPDIFKKEIAEWPLKEAALLRQDFNQVDFGWWGVYWPSEKELGTQLDMWEYGTSKAAAWDCPAAIQFSLSSLENVKRMGDLLEMMRRWENVREKNLLTSAERAALKDPGREFHLFRDEKGGYELCEIELLETSAKGLRGFLFERGGRRVLAYWHTWDAGAYDIDLGSVRRLEASDLRYLMTDLPREAVRQAFAAAVVA